MPQSLRNRAVRSTTPTRGGHGIGRHTRARIAELAIRDVDALATILGNKRFLTGDKPCAADAFVFGIVTSITVPPLDSPVRAAMRRQANLVSYRDRIASEYFPEHPVGSNTR